MRTEKGARNVWWDPFVTNSTHLPRLYTFGNLLHAATSSGVTVTLSGAAVTFSEAAVTFSEAAASSTDLMDQAKMMADFTDCLGWASAPRKLVKHYCR